MPSSRLIDLSFPAELLLEVIQHVPFDDAFVAKLSLIHPRIKSLLTNHEISITKHFIRSQLPHALTDFPTEVKNIGYAWLSQCIHQYDTMDGVMATLTSELNCFAVQNHNMALVNTGLLLLYRLFSFDAHEDKIAFIKSLPRDPLTAMFLAVHYSKYTARYNAKGIINQRTYGRFLDTNQLLLRNEIEFSFSEGVMNLGPAFISDVLSHIDAAETTLMCLYHDNAQHGWGTQEENFQPPVTQGPAKNPVTKPRTLYTTLLERLAELYDCPLEEAVTLIEDDTDIPDHPLSCIGLWGKARLLKGLNLENGEDGVE
ncbi:hypothetical protein K469DRAFT_747728 [Zopfia rhizophila CBS 207.26]|uniref:F-box domain-containing protein n=1 Tax=Zopfia rhizophila CBS 207.26 TaxID=1314779 RepID=A0A6A6EIK3_9PEZI|nr:hypothetical protein K469DRAFT_747728 [Zopfia rhizophila CBS 207.26]